MTFSIMHCVANMLILYNQMNNPSINPTNAFDIQRFSHLDVPTKYQHVSGITILIPMGRFLITISMFIGDYQYPCIHLYTGPAFGVY